MELLQPLRVPRSRVAACTARRAKPGEAGVQERRHLRSSKAMSIKRILLPIPGTLEHSGEIDMGLSAAKALGAHIDALFITEPSPPSRVRMAVGEGYGTTAPGTPIEQLAEERERGARQARERFAQACS